MRTLVLALLLAVVTAPVHADTGIAWYGTLASGLEAARRHQRPILLVSAAPHCHSVSGIW